MSRISVPFPPPIAGQHFRLVSNTAFFRSPLDGTVQTQARPGSRWEFDVNMQLLDDTRLGQWMAAFAQAQDQGATFYWNNYPKARPLNFPTGSGWGTPLVNGASQTGGALICDGFTVGITLKAGDCFAFDNGTYREMHQLTADVTANGLGQATLNFVPIIRRSPADNVAILLDGHSGVDATLMACEVIVVDGSQADWQSSGFQMSGSIKLVEIPR
jgi:hypothetical protein